MIDASADRLRDDYLIRLDAAMAELPHGVAGDLRAGIEEELTGLDGAAVAARIAQLGEPEQIVRGAAEEIPGAAHAPVPVAPARLPATSTRGFAVTAALVLSFGGIVVPFVGWVVGAVLVSLSPLWRTGEKALAILVPMLAAVLVLAGGLLPWAEASEVVSSADSVAAANPLMPAWYDLLWSVPMIAGLLLVPASGLWLIWRLRGRTAP